MMGRRNLARAIATALGALIVLVAALQGTALAAAPELTIQPFPGNATDSQMPVFSGTTNDVHDELTSAFDPVTLDIYAKGSLVQAPTTGVPTQTGLVEDSWEITPETPLEQGEYTAVAEQTNQETETGTSAPPMTFKVETRPVVTLASPAENAVLKASEPTLSGQAGDATWDGQVTVVVHEGGSTAGNLVVEESVSASAGTWSYSPSLSDGVYTVQASQSDEVGDTGTSSAVTFTVDANAPVVTLTSPAGGALLKSSSQSLSGAAASAPWDDPSVTVAIHEGDSLSGKLEASGSAPVSGGKWSYGSHLSTGEYTAQVSQTDQAGHTGTSSAVTFRVDATAPVVTLTSPTAGALLEISEPKLSGGAGAAAWDDQSVTVAIHEGGSLTGEVVAESESVLVTDGTWSYAAPALSNGIYTAQASQSDAAGRLGTSAAVTFTIDATAPEVTLTSPADNAYVKTSHPTLSGGAGAAAWDSHSVAVAIHDGTTLAGVIAASGTVSESSGKWAYSPSHLEDGTYTAAASQKDEAGHTGESTPPVTFTVDTKPPALTLARPAGGEVLETSEPTFSGLAGQATGDRPLVTLKIYKGSSVSGSPQTLEVVPAGGEWTGPSGLALPNGTYTVLAEQSDEAGNRTERIATFRIATTAPEVTLSTSGFKGSEPHLLAEPTPSFSGTGATKPQDGKTITVKIYSGKSASGTPTRTLTGALSGSAWTAGPIPTTEPLEDGIYTAQAEQEGPLAQTGHSSPVTFTVDTKPPSVTLAPPGNSKAFVKTSEPTLTGTAGAAAWDAAVTVAIYKGGSLTGTPVASGSIPASTTWSYSAPHLPDGLYTAEATQGDEAGHTGTSGAVTFTIDTTRPALTLETPEEKEVLHVSQPIFSGRAGDASGDLPFGDA